MFVGRTYTHTINRYAWPSEAMLRFIHMHRQSFKIAKENIRIYMNIEEWKKNKNLSKFMYGYLFNFSMVFFFVVLVAAHLHISLFCSIWLLNLFSMCPIFCLWPKPLTTIWVQAEYLSIYLGSSSLLVNDNGMTERRVDFSYIYTWANQSIWWNIVELHIVRDIK